MMRRSRRRYEARPRGGDQGPYSETATFFWDGIETRMRNRLQRTMIFVGALATMLNVLGAQRALAQSSTPREETWVTNGTVNAIVRTTDTIYIGGFFTYVGPDTGNGAPFDSTTGRPAATFPEVNEVDARMLGHSSGI